MNHTPLERLRYHVTGAIERGEKEAIIEQPVTKETRMTHTPGPSYKLSFDGCGFNDATDEHKRRLFTAARQDWDDLKVLGEQIVHRYNTHDALVEALQQIEARAVYMKVKDPTYAETHWEYVRQACRNALAESEV